MEVLGVAAAIAIAAGLLAALLFAATPRADPAMVATGAIGEELGRRRSVRMFLRARVRRGVATGLALTVCLLAVTGAGIALGILIYMVRTQTGLVQVDRAVGQWSDPRMTAVSISVFDLLTWFGSTVVVVGLGVLAAVYAYWRWRNPAIPVFLALVIGGQLLLSNLIKDIVQRARPDLHPLAGFSGPSFPSGHTTAAAATFIAIALVVGRDWSPRGRRNLAGAAVALAVAVACSRVFLGVHWVSDVIGGLILGWTWVAVCAIAFGGRVMRFGSPAKAAVAAPEDPGARPDTRDAVGVRSTPRG
jgi:membrane-associated phospholipid phosphatase